MPDNFKKFIDTSGKSLDEIKRLTEELLKKSKPVVRSVGDDINDNIGRGIRKRISDVIMEAELISAESGDNAANDSAADDTAADAGAAEAVPLEERGRTAAETRPDGADTLSPDEIAYPHESVPEHLSEHEQWLTDKISEMRTLRQTTYNGYIVQRCAEVTFVMQGDFMADITDDFPRRAFCGITMPMYAAMSVSQLRTYFTWRTDARRGKYRETDRAYVILYCYELLNRIGVVSAADAFGRLLDLREGCGDFAGYLNELLPRWLKDFYAFNDISAAYPDINDYVESNEDKTVSEILGGNYRGKLEFLADNSAYNIRGSSFFTEENKPLLEGAARYALEALGDYFGQRGIEPGVLLCGRLEKDYSWAPFRGALVNLDRTDGFKPVRINASEAYCIRRGEPSLERFVFLPQRGFIGYVLKCVEARLRINTGFNRKIKPNKDMLLKELQNREKLIAAVSGEAFEDAVNGAVDRFCRENGVFAKKKTRLAGDNGDTVNYVRRSADDIEIDVSRLSEIRERADEITRKLIIDEEEPAPDESRIEQIAEKISDDEFDERIAEYSALAGESGESDDSGENENEVHEKQEANESPRKGNARNFSGVSGRWREFAESLSEQQLDVLGVLAEGKSADGFCRGIGLLAETVFEQINAAALMYTNDIIIENGEVIGDYLEKVREIVGL